MNIHLHLTESDPMANEKLATALDKLSQAVNDLPARVASAVQQQQTGGLTAAESDAVADQVSTLADNVNAVDATTAVTTTDITGQVPATPSGEAAPPTF